MDHFHPMQFGPALDLPELARRRTLMRSTSCWTRARLRHRVLHPTTALCPQWLDVMDPAGKTVVIPCGCGPASLGIAGPETGLPWPSVQASISILRPSSQP